MANLVVIRIASSGLGNLLFQLCGAEEVARRSGAALRLDLDSVSGDQLTSARSGNADKVLAIARMYGFEVERASAAEIWATRGGWQGQNKLTRWLARLQVQLGLVRSSYFGFLSAFNYDKRFAVLHAPVYLDGYLINPRYFCAAVGARVCEGDLGEFADLVASIGASNSVSIHVRRGDYCQLDGYPLYGMEYVAEAVRLIEARVGVGEYFLFTDDVEWARGEIHLPRRNITLVSARTRAAWHDLELMRQCKHNIISNSTFSWWAAYRNANSGHVVVMPANWATNTNEPIANSLRQPDWIVIEG